MISFAALVAPLLLAAAPLAVGDPPGPSVAPLLIRVPLVRTNQAGNKFGAFRTTKPFKVTVALTDGPLVPGSPLPAQLHLETFTVTPRSSMPGDITVGEISVAGRVDGSVRVMLGTDSDNPLPSDLHQTDVWYTSAVTLINKNGVEKFTFGPSASQLLGLAGITEGRDLAPRSVLLEDPDALRFTSGAVDGAVLTSDENGQASWLQLGTNGLADNSVTLPKMADDSVGSDEIIDGSIGSADIGEGAVGSFEVADESLTADDLGPDSVASAEILDRSIETQDIAEGAVGQFELGDGSVATSELVDGAVTMSKLAINSVGGAQVLDNSLTALDLGPDSVGSSELQANSVGSSEIQTNAVGSDEIAANAVGSSEIANNAVGASEIADGAVGSSEVANNSLTEDDIAANSIGPSEHDEFATGFWNFGFGGFGNVYMAMEIPDSLVDGGFWSGLVIQHKAPAVDGFSLAIGNDPVNAIYHFTVSSNGTINLAGSLTQNDGLAHMLESTDAQQPTLGDVLIIDPSGKRSVKRSQGARTTLVAGVYKEDAGLIASHRDWIEPNGPVLGEGPAMPALTEGGQAQAANARQLYPQDMYEKFADVPVAMSGIVRCKVSTENGAIMPGDLLVTSSTPGHAMRDAAPRPGTILGKALEPLASGTGLIQIMVTLD